MKQTFWLSQVQIDNIWWNSALDDCDVIVNKYNSLKKRKKKTICHRSFPIESTITFCNTTKNIYKKNYNLLDQILKNLHQRECLSKVLHCLLQIWHSCVERDCVQWVQGVFIAFYLFLCYCVEVWCRNYSNYFILFLMKINSQSYINHDWKARAVELLSEQRKANLLHNKLILFLVKLWGCKHYHNGSKHHFLQILEKYNIFRQQKRLGDPSQIFCYELKVFFLECLTGICFMQSANIFFKIIWEVRGCLTSPSLASQTLHFVQKQDYLQLCLQPISQ